MRLPRQARAAAAWRSALFLATLGGLLVAFSTPGVQGSTATSHLAAARGAPPSVSLNCNAVYTPQPSSLLTLRPQPTRNLTAGGSLESQMEMEDASWTSSSAPVNFTLPTVFFDFPLASGATFTMHLAPQNVTIRSAGWTSPTQLAVTAHAPAGVNFSATQPARIDSQKLAIMSSANYGGALLKVRWRWIELWPNSSKVTFGNWSVPTTQQNFPKQEPSTFFPAAYVRLVNTSASPAIIGTNYTMTITGPYVAGEWFFQELEFPSSGHVVEGYAETVPNNTSVYPVEVPLLAYGHYLDPGPYLAHVHDECGALLYSRTVQTHYEAHANVSLIVQPGCSGINWNGTRYTTNTTLNVTPSVTPYIVTAKACNGLKIAGSILTGDLHRAGIDKIQVSGDGTLRIWYV